MLQLIPLPIVWLGAYVLGQTLRTRSLPARRYVITVVSLVVLLAAAGLKTWIFYVTLSLGILFAGYILSTIENVRFHKIAFVVSITAVVLLIAGFLEWRIFFQKFFVYLPSLSYLGFRGIAYLTSVYQGRNVHFSAGLMQMFFFPMLFMGPISRVENFEEEVEEYSDILRRLTLGLAMLIAGHLVGFYVLTDLRDPSTIHWFRYWLGALANSFELYFTFAGYSHLIIGLGLLVGFKLPENFNNPYLASSISEFWRRWHMSLSYWIRDYVYIPLGGSRKGITRKCLNILIAMGLCGIWHGLTLNFFLWGIFHGLLLAMESLMFNIGFKPLCGLPDKIYRPIKVLITFSLVTFGWLLFKYPLSEFLIYIKSMVAW